MALPTHDDLKQAVLEHLVRQKGRQATSAEVAEILSKRFKLSKTDLSQKVSHTHRPGGESAWRLQLRRVKYSLVKDGAVEGGQRGIWCLAR